MSRIRPALSCVLALALCVPLAARAWENDGDPTWDHDGDDTWDHSWDDHDRYCPDDDDHADSSVVQQKLATKFGVEESQIAGLRDENLGYGEIDHTLTLAERMPGGITDENVANVLEMRQDQHMGWGQIAKAEGTTLGKAKREYPTQPPVEPQPVATTQPASTAQPKSLVRSGKSSVASGSSASASAAQGGKSGKSGKSSVSRGPSNRAAKTTMTATSSSARSGHAYGRGGSSGGSSAKSNGKAKGHK